VYPEPLGYEKKTTRTKLSGTFMIVVCIRVISRAIFAFVSVDTNPSSVIAVYKGIGVFSQMRDINFSELAVYAPGIS
jgi:hypothetical protein